jgi:hypothetical protein
MSKGSQHSSLSENGRRVLQGICILKARSWMTYLIFLLNMTVPFISLAALPGGLSRLISEHSNYEVGFSFFAAQLVIIFLVLMTFLIKRITTLLTIKNVTCI